MNKEFLSALAIILMIAAYVPYIRSIYRGQTKPHVFSWLIWGLATAVVFLAQTADGAGTGARSIGISAVAALYIAFLAYQRRSANPNTKADWVFFTLAVTSLPIWYLTHNPFWAVVILTVVDTLGFGPTFHKSYHKPYEEHLSLYLLMTLSNLISITALENYSWTTVLFPAVVSLTCIVFIALVLLRRASIKPS